MGLKLNLGCGTKNLPGYVNVDKFGAPELKFDLETFPWPWETSSVSEILLVHVLEHLGHDPSTFLRIMQELYRVCEGGATIGIVVPHPRHDFYLADPTHVRPIMPLGLALFSKRANRQWQQSGASNSQLAMFLDVDFEVVQTEWKPSAEWFRLHPEKPVNMNQLLEEGAVLNNLIEEIHYLVKVIK